jgi:chromosome segregation ATPase
MPAQAPSPVPNGDRKPEAATSSSEEDVVTATAIVTARLAELEAEIARSTRDAAALASERRDLQERINALSGQTLEANQRLNKLRGSVPNTDDETPGRQHLVPAARHSTTIGQVKVGG